MKEIINSKQDLCTGCNRCVRECPMETANITFQDENKNIKVTVDHDKCIACGRCISACKHNSRYYSDDIDVFFKDLAAGIPVSLMAAPSVRTNIPEYKKIFTYLKNMGVKKIYDVSLGADICIWAHIRLMEKTNYAPLITQPCPAIVTYCRIYRHELLEKISPVHSPMGCTSVYMKEYEGITDKIAALSPCIAKTHEFDDTNLAQYNITFFKLNEYLEKNNVKLPKEETDFDNERNGVNKTGLGSLFPMPGGLKENIELFCGNRISIDKAEGFNVYKKLDTYAETPLESLPKIFDVLNCEEGCNIGTASLSSKKDIFKISRRMDKKRENAKRRGNSERFDSLLKNFDQKLDYERFLRKYEMVPFKLKDITEEEIQEAFLALGKTNYEKQNIDCGACGSNTCHEMARKIALGVNIPLNCIKKEHEENLAAHEQILLMQKQHEIDEQNIIQLAKLNLIANNSKIGLFDMKVDRKDPLNPQNHFTWSDGFRRLFGYENEIDFPNLLGSFKNVLHPDDMERTDNAFYSHLLDKTGNTPYDVEYRGIKKNGDIAYFHATAETIRDEDGNPVHVAGAIMDITELKTTLIETQRLREEAEEANKAKTTFLSTMSHEIRTPMNAILGITEIQLQKQDLDLAIKDAFEKIYSSGDMLLGIINDILDLSKIEAGKMELITEKYELASLLSDTVQLNMMRIGSKPIEFELDIDENALMHLSGDELRIKQILNNLLSNAFKYTQKGSVKMSVLTESYPDGNAVLVISIRDTGQGMTKEQLDRLGSEYSRFNLNANRTTEGTGLGMKITQNLIQIMKGEITIESEPGKGSCFTIFIPQGKVSDEVLGSELAGNLKMFKSTSKAQMKRVQISREPMPYGSILIVDDVDINIYVAKGLLAPYRLKIDSVNSGFLAMEKIKSGNVYDVVFMDHMMPEMDGIETTIKLREMGYNQPIVALTANAVSGQAEVFLENGFNDFISKPIDVRQLNTVLNKFVRDKQPPEIIHAAHMAEEKRRAEVLQKEKGNKYAEIFIMDAEKSIAALEMIYEKKGEYSDEDMRMFIIHVHGMKAALGTIGRIDLSGTALRLETLAKDGEKKAISSEMPAFIEALKKLICELKPKETGGETEITDEDRKHLREKLLFIKEACENYDGSAADKLLAELKGKPWPADVRNLLSAVSGHLLHSDFDKAAEAAGSF